MVLSLLMLGGKGVLEDKKDQISTEWKFADTKTMRCMGLTSGVRKVGLEQCINMLKIAKSTYNIDNKRSCWFIISMCLYLSEHFITQLSYSAYVHSLLGF